MHQKGRRRINTRTNRCTMKEEEKNKG